MNTRSSRFAHLRATVLGAIALVAIVAACEAKLPTAADVEKMDAASAEKASRDLLHFKVALSLDGDSGVAYFIDGVKATAAQAKALGPERIGSIEVTKEEISGGRPKAEIRIATRKAGDPVSLPRKETRIEIAGAGEKIAGLKQDMLTHDRTFDGVLIVDGVRVIPSALSTLNPDDIVSVEVIKNEVATKLYPDPEAAKGVIRITTKKGTAKK